MITNLRRQLEVLNNYTFTDSEWKRFFTEILANANDSIVEKSRTIQTDHVKVLRRDDGTSKNIQLIDKRTFTTTAYRSSISTRKARATMTPATM